MTELWSALTGIGTLALAAATFYAVRQGQRLQVNADRQHRDRFKPICLLTPYTLVDAQNGREALIKAIPPGTENPGYGHIVIHCLLKNVGAGPALKLCLRFRFMDMQGWSSDPCELSPLGSGESIGSTTDPLVVPFRLSEHFNQTDFALLQGKAWEIWLEYEDVFGQAFQSIHRKATFDQDPSTITWTDATSGRRSKAALRPVPWLTYSEGPSLNAHQKEGAAR